ncbi:VOC family protein [Nocardia seriolae]|uniref:Glyoxalase n=1 Tax=Nocardia seriolae TaxID=37332 RepID=A0A0B8N6I5_9NOCA|nr:VOC family protein [Nocardia seriolae]MTJ63501.1 glyoxalase [Nocardia seriolae]MTJ73996.1 glyoxalase [Nocardia seriolae]MTJ88538.1 glyoxalase [Nocardia seriolae]MTK32522.1 glyoxalase [Nocardia seriolae]MTK41400.1 glyoxalase [Nocardia seriolae]
MIIRLNVIGIVVSDMAASLRFYRRLGIDFADGAEQQPHVDADLGGGIKLMLDTEDTVRSFRPDWAAPRSPGRLGLACECSSPAAVDEKFEELVAAGHPAEMKPFDAFWGQRYAVVLDPDGNSVDLYATSN